MLIEHDGETFRRGPAVAPVHEIGNEVMRLCHTDPKSARTYIALLRAINVGGTSVITMADLKAQFEALGHANVRTYIQTGNVLFEAPEESTSQLAERAEQQLRAGLGYAGRVFVLTPQQLADADANNPFAPEASDGAMVTLCEAVCVVINSNVSHAIVPPLGRVRLPQRAGPGAQKCEAA